MKKNGVFWASLAVTASVAAVGLFFPKTLTAAANGLLEAIVSDFSWLYLSSMFAFVVFALYMAFGRFGGVKLGDDDSTPEHSYVSWFGMLFGAGMGIGLVFWGVAEPLSHYVAFGMNEEAARMAMKKSFMHWGFHPWAGYSILGMALGYFQFRKKAPGMISSVFLPLLGQKGVLGPVGKTIDICAIFATVAGIATSLGQGALQINAGLSYLFGLPANASAQIAIVLAITVVYTWTAISGIDKGIAMLSNVNMALAAILLAGCFAVGPKLMALNILTSATGDYINSFIADSLAVNPFGDNSWLGGWTVFYWAWWIAWGPFVGTFIARISKGRTIREFVAGVILAPSVASLVWFSVFGSLGLSQSGALIQEAAKSAETALFVVLGEYPFGLALSITALLLLCTFFITSANSATFVLAMFSANGELNPPNAKKLAWGVIQALMALSLLLSGGLSALQACSIIAAFPFAIIMLLSCFCLLKAMIEGESP
ncbi:MAG: BCCT family transporter, partial [Synergistaceae bacterium]|nr:BCCT family transporter [Synergistaceae bacterium]